MTPESVAKSSSSGPAAMRARFDSAPSLSASDGSREAAESGPVARAVCLFVLLSLWVVIVFLGLWPSLCVVWMRVAKQVSR